jgi:hypothetical protein
MRNEEPAQSCVLSREPKNLATKWQAHRVRTVYGSDNRHQHSAGPCGRGALPVPANFHPVGLDYFVKDEDP